MTSSEQDDFVDRVAQAVIDKIEERDETEYLINKDALIFNLNHSADNSKKRISCILF